MLAYDYNVHWQLLIQHKITGMELRDMLCKQELPPHEGASLN